MVTLHAEAALLPQGWRANVRLSLSKGRIALVESDVAASAADERHRLILPAMPNLHSHAFQRAIAGLTEIRGPAGDNFWSWREVMYRFALSMTPDQVEAVAAQLYVEMLEAGFCRVGEFHYLHHDRNGAAYIDIAEMAGRIAAASQAAGIGLTLLPVFYAQSGFNAAPPVEGQRRFVNSLESFARVMERSREICRDLPGARLGLAPHSLRAVTPPQLAELPALAGAGPIHIHVAEQMKEVEDCLAWSGARPVAWLLDHAPVDAAWCLIHATHLTAGEVSALAASGAVAGLCPITEANLGDGIFPAAGFIEAGGRLGIGSDSNLLISVDQELRQLEYSQRLALRARNIVAAPGGSTGQGLYQAALTGGAQALGVSSGLVEGAEADLLSLDLAKTPHAKPEQALDHWIFAGGASVDCVWTAGRKQVEKGQHRHRHAIRQRFDAALQELLSA